MTALVIKELAAFRSNLRRDVIADRLSRPTKVRDDALLKAVAEYGNTYLKNAVNHPENANAVIWFDIHFGDPAVIGLTWAYNPIEPKDRKTGADIFWRIWSETAPDGTVMSLTQCQRELGSYILQNGTQS